MWGINPTKHYYDIFTVKLDGLDGRFKGQVVLTEYYGSPQPLVQAVRQEIASLIAANASDLTFITRALEGCVEVWDAAFGLPTHRLRKSHRFYVDEPLGMFYVPEKKCPQCGLPASKGDFIRGALVCRKHNYLFGGC